MLYIVIGSLILTIFSFMYLFVMSIKKYVFLEKIKDINLKLIIASSCVLLFWLLTYSLNAVYERIQNPPVTDGIEQYSGTLGDLVGGTLNPILGLFGILVGGLAFYAQYDANKKVQEQFEKQEIKEYRQNFESKLFVLVEFQNQIVQNIDINKTIFNTELIIEIIDNNPIINSKYEEFHLENIYESEFKNEEVKSRDSFKFFFELLDSILSISNDYLQNHNQSHIITDIELEDSEGKEEVEIAETTAEETEETEENYFDVFRINFEKRIIESNDKIVEDYFDSIYEMLFGKLKIDLGHYYRNLYRVFKIIDQANFDKNDDVDFKIKYEYASIVRSQLSDYELYFLFYNGLSQYGNLKFKKLIEKYSLLKIIPIDNMNLQFHKYHELYDKKAFNNKLKV